MKAASDAELIERLPHLPIERDTAEHYRGYLRRELVMNRCADCRKRSTVQRGGAVTSRGRSARLLARRIPSWPGSPWNIRSS